MALRTPGSLDRYRLFGLDEIAERGVSVRHNLERESTPLWAQAAGRMANVALDATGGVGGDFATVLASLTSVNGADVVFSTVDTVGIPTLFLKWAGLVRPPVVYASIGLPERLARLRNERTRRAFRQVLTRARTVIAYAVREADELREWGGDVVFIPFGVDTDAFAPQNAASTIDVLSVGADPRRDFDLLLQIAARRREQTFHIITTSAQARALGAAPNNVRVETDVPLETVRERYAQARVVVLPVRENSYSGATTTLLQAMSMAKPVVVSRTDAIAEGYALEDGVNGRFVPPGDADSFERALVELLSDSEQAADLGARARLTVERGYTWQRYVDALWAVLSAASERP